MKGSEARKGKRNLSRGRRTPDDENISSVSSKGKVETKIANIKRNDLMRPTELL